jgi:tRNA guanosine-2'-O-methyltransferase
LLTVAVIQVQGDVSGHVEFLLNGFLPWATLGELFTSTLIANRDTTVSVHGASLADVIARFILISPDTAHTEPELPDGSIKSCVNSSRRAVIFGVLDFILDARGKIFQFSILYLLEGLAKGLRACSDGPPLQVPFGPSEIDKISRISRLPGLPEIAGDLYKEYCAQICDLTSPGWMKIDNPACQQIYHEAQRSRTSMEARDKTEVPDIITDTLPPLRALRKRLEESRHSCIQGDNYAPTCRMFIKTLDRTTPSSIDYTDLHVVLEAFWEEADRRQFSRPVAIHIPSVLFHPTCVRVCITQQSCKIEETSEGDICALLSRAMDRLQRLSEGRTYVLSTLGNSIRRAVLTCPELLGILPLEDYILRFLNSPPTIKTEFLFEVAAAEKLQQYQPWRTYRYYYGSREWHAYAAMIDLLGRFPEEQADVAQRILDRLLDPWKSQKTGIPIISKWKNVLQLQAMLMLVDFCVQEAEVDAYLVSFKHALTLEAWPRYRFLLEWIIARIYYQFPGKASHILDDLSKLDESGSTHIASLMKLAVLVAPRESEHFSLTFMTQLVPFAASPKVQIRHESNYAIPIIFDLALSKGWTSITENSAFVSLDAFIRSLDKFQSTPWTIRTLKLDAVNDFTLVKIFQGQYLTIESPEKARVAYEDFVALQEADHASGLTAPPGRISLGVPVDAALVANAQTPKPTAQLVSGVVDQASPAFFQTKSGFDMNTLIPQSGPPSVQNQRPASVVLVASLIDNPTNLGGLSRISESFGLEALYIDDVRQTAHKDFKATSVTSEKHFPIRELKLASVPQFLLDMKGNGYEVVGIEQTDQSGILGTEDINETNSKGLGILPKKCVLVLGSEKGGINAEVLAAVDRCVEIRTVGVTRSLSKCDPIRAIECS